MMYEERERSLQNQQMNMELYLSYVGQTEDELREQMKPQAEERLNTMLMLRKLADIEEIEIADEDVEEEINNLIASTGGESDAAMRQALSTENAQSSIRSTLMNRKIMTRLVEITQGEESANAATDPAEIKPEAEPEEETN